MVSSPAQASRLESWRYNSNQNRLEFTTDTDVQPRAQLIADPIRLVIDLPGIRLGRPVINQALGGTIRSIRVGQFDRDTTRVVVELAPGYTIDPQQVRFRGITARQWTVQLPNPQPLPEREGISTVSTAPPFVVPTTTSRPPISSTLSSRGDIGTVQGVQVTQDGFFIRTSGNPSEVKVDRSSDRQQIVLEIQGAMLAPRAQRDIPIDRFGVSRMQMTQIQSSPPVTRVTLNVNSNSPDWLASISNLGGVVLLPSGGVAATTIAARPVEPRPSLSYTSHLATIQSIQLENNGTQLVIRADQPLTYSTGWDKASGSYRLTINAAQFSSSVRGSELTAASPILRLQLRQEDARTAAILVQPAAGVQIGNVNQPGQQILALQLERSRPASIPPSRSPIASIPVPSAPRSYPSAATLPRVPNGRLIVVIDPGHGGPDPGAIGIAGLQEKELVLDIGSQVAQILEQQGIQSILTRPDDRDLDLQPRVDMAEQVHATVFVSIHANSIDLSRPDISGLETYYYDSGEQLAHTIHRSILDATGIPDRRVRQARFYVLRKTSMPSVLVEVGFVTGRDDAARLSDSSYRRQMAAAIARGIVQYLQRGS